MCPPNPTIPESPHLKAAQERNEQNTTEHKRLLKNLTFQDPPKCQEESRAFVNQPSSVSECQLAPEKTHLSRFFSPNSIPNNLTSMHAPRDGHIRFRGTAAKSRKSSPLTRERHRLPIHIGISPPAQALLCSCKGSPHGPTSHESGQNAPLAPEKLHLDWAILPDPPHRSSWTVGIRVEKWPNRTPRIHSPLHFM